MFWEDAKHVLFLVAKKNTKRRRLKGTFRKGRTDGMIATGNHRYCRFAARSTTLKKPLRRLASQRPKMYRFLNAYSSKTCRVFTR